MRAAILSGESALPWLSVTDLRVGAKPVAPSSALVDGSWAPRPKALGFRFRRRSQWLGHRLLLQRVIEHFVEGMVHVSTMADDYYRFVENAHMLRGENTHKAYRLGDKVKVQVIRVNMDARQIDLGLVDILARVRKGERGPRRSKARP